MRRRPGREATPKKNFNYWGKIETTKKTKHRRKVTQGKATLKIGPIILWFRTTKKRTGYCGGDREKDGKPYPPISSAG